MSADHESRMMEFIPCLRSRAKQWTTSSGLQNDGVIRRHISIDRDGVKGASDHIFEQAKVEEKAVDQETLQAELEKIEDA